MSLHWDRAPVLLCPGDTASDHRARPLQSLAVGESLASPRAIKAEPGPGGLGPAPH